MFAYSPPTDLLTWLFMAFWLLVLGTLVTAICRPRKIRHKIIWTLITLLVLGGAAGLTVHDRYQQAEHFQQRLNVAEAAFRKHCPQAGERIEKTVDGVDGLLLTAPREVLDNRPLGQDFRDPAGNLSNPGGEAYIRSFLGEAGRPGFAYVEMVDPTDGKRYRYTRATPSDVAESAGATPPLQRTLATGDAPRFVLQHDDPSTPGDRELWIAGSTLRIVDQSTQSIIAERSAYIHDRWQGLTASGRQPWHHALRWSCPTSPGEIGEIRDERRFRDRQFALRVLHPQ